MVVRTIMLILPPFLLLIFCGVCNSSKPLQKPNPDGIDLKSIVKTIQTENGDIYDCVDFYQQPALQHPSLKNHNFHPQMRPTSSPQRMKPSGFSGQTQELNIKLKDGGCPTGTVPIRRIEKDELTQFKLLKHNFSSSEARTNSVFRPPGTIFALAQTRNNPGTKPYNGAGAYLSVYNPKVGPSQYSSAEIIIQDGPDMIEIGWTVNPGVMKKDKVTRLFLYTVAGNTHCFNSECGFVIVNTEIPIGFELTPVSTVGGKTYVYQYFIYQDEMNGNWWLELGRDNIVVGFWPREFFSGLSQSASYVACGGEVYQPPGQSPSVNRPEMGSGYRAFRHDRTEEAFCGRFLLVNEAHQVVHASGTEEFANNKDYPVVDSPVREKPDHFVFYGGPYVSA